MSFDVAESLFRTMDTQCNRLFISFNLYCLKNSFFYIFTSVTKPKIERRENNLSVLVA